MKKLILTIVFVLAVAFNAFAQAGDGTGTDEWITVTPADADCRVYVQSWDFSASDSEYVSLNYILGVAQYAPSNSLKSFQVWTDVTFAEEVCAPVTVNRVTYIASNLETYDGFVQDINLPALDPSVLGDGDGCFTIGETVEIPDNFYRFGERYEITGIDVELALVEDVDVLFQTTKVGFYGQSGNVCVSTR